MGKITVFHVIILVLPTLLLAGCVSTPTQNRADKDGEMPLHTAAKGGQTDTAKLLISKGAEINTKNKYDSTPLRLAAYRGHTDTIQLLKKHGGKL